MTGWFAKGQEQKGRWDTRVLASKLVRILAIMVAGLVASAPFTARADQREELVAKGEQAAKDGRFADAIDSFKAADRIQPRASHACLIALAYTRRELWSQAQHWLGICHDRASATDPMPDWTPLAEKQIKERLEASNVAAVTIVVKPAAVKAKITVSSFAPDETFEARTIHLPPGTHVVFAKAEGYTDQQKTIEVRDKTPQTIVIDYSGLPMARPVAPKEDRFQPVGPTPEPVDGSPGNGMSTGLIVGGAGLLLFGGVSQWVMGRHWDKMKKATDDFKMLSLAEMQMMENLDMARAAYGAAEKPYERWRILSVTGYVLGAAMVVTGILIRKKAPNETAVSAVPLPEGGAFVSVGWSR
jgi:hypothetical protein